MPRRVRKILNTSFFHVIVQGVNREFIFKEDKYKKKYLQLLKKVKKQYMIDIIAYAIMGNHSHILIHTDDIKILSNFMKKVNEDYARYYNYEKNRVGYVFRNRFLSEPITNQKYLLTCIAYIHNNPVKANVSKKCENYKYSSYCDYLNMTGFVDENIIEMIFGSGKMDVGEYKKLHVEKTYYFMENEDMLESNMQEIIKELEGRYKKEWGKLIKETRILEEIVPEIKERIVISNCQLAKYLKIHRHRVENILKKDIKNKLTRTE